MGARTKSDPVADFHPAVRDWFQGLFPRATPPQTLGWPAIARGESTLILAPTGSGKTLTAFLWCLDRLMFAPPPPRSARCRVIYISPLKALAVDVERNLRVPLAGIARAADARHDGYLTPTIAVRTGDTPAADRARFLREPADILITTPESLYLLLTSQARDMLQSVETVIIDEIHALVPTKRGAHLALSLERLTRRCATPPQRIGLSATQRPLDEVARFLGGASGGPQTSSERRSGRGRSSSGSGTASDAARAIAGEFSGSADVVYRPVTVVDASAKKTLALRIEVPIEDMTRLSTAGELPSGPASVGDTRPSIWSAIHPRLVDLIRSHRSTLIFVNSRRLAERLAGAINELAGETLAGAHHGSVAREQRTEIEERLKAGTLRALVATSSLELGIDMGAIDLVVQVEAPPSVASGLQRIGRSGHRIDAVSEGIIFPKFRGDLLACAAVTWAMHRGEVEATRYPRNALDIVAQQVVAMTSVDTWNVDDLLTTIRQAAPFATLTRTAFEGVLDMLSGRYPSDDFAELRPRITWHRSGGTVVAREGAKRVAIANGGTIPDRGLFGVFLAGAAPGSARVGELDEEMVFETPVGDTFVLGASTWRVEEITHDRVIVSPAPGEPGRMPFWKGDQSGRPLELGLAIGRLTRDLLRMPAPAALARLERDHDLERGAAENLLQYLRDQKAATGAVPDAETIQIERVRDELGDWRVCVLSPRGGRVHAPWAMAVASRIREDTGIDVETLWGDEGFVVRFPDVDQPPDPTLLIPGPDDVQGLVVRQLGGTALFAAKFRENAARSLLLPKRRPGMRAPLWQQRKRSADLLAVAARYPSFPVLLETYRECLRDFFDMPGLVSTLADISSHKIRVVTVDSEKPSPFAASVLFSYVASFLYDGDAPLAERRAQALIVDQAQLRELVGDAELRDLLELDAFSSVERQLQRLEPNLHVKHADALHDLLLSLGDLTADDIRARSASSEVADSLVDLVRTHRVIEVTIAGQARYIAVEDAGRYRDALGVDPSKHVPAAFLAPTADALGELARRYARTHPPFAATAFAERYGLDIQVATAVLVRLTGEGRLIEGEFRPGGTRREWTDANVLRLLRRRSLAALRHQVEPVEQAVLGRLLTAWHGVGSHRRGPDALLDVVEQLQGAPLPASILETEVLPSRLDGYDPADLDAVAAAGEVVWMGVEPMGERDGRLTLYLADALPRLAPPIDVQVLTALGTREAAILDALESRGASFFGPLHDAVGGGYPAETVGALWTLVWLGLVTNDAFHALRAYTRASTEGRRRRPRGEVAPFRSRRLVPASAEGRWTLVRRERSAKDKRLRSRDTERAAAIAEQLMARHGVLAREAVASELVPGGFGSVYPVLKAFEERGRAQRGYFVTGLGAAQFALPGALSLLRSLKNPPDDAEAIALPAPDPANPYGAILPWPSSRIPAGTSDEMPAQRTGIRGPSRSVGATVVLVHGALAAYLARGEHVLLTWLPDSEPLRSRSARAIVGALIDRAQSGGDQGRGLLLEEIDSLPASSHPLARFLIEAGFVSGALGLRAPLKRGEDVRS